MSTSSSSSSFASLAKISQIGWLSPGQRETCVDTNRQHGPGWAGAVPGTPVYVILDPDDGVETYYMGESDRGGSAVLLDKDGDRLEDWEVWRREGKMLARVFQGGAWERGDRDEFYPFGRWTEGAGSEFFSLELKEVEEAIKPPPPPSQDISWTGFKLDLS